MERSSVHQPNAVDPSARAVCSFSIASVAQGERARQTAAAIWIQRLRRGQLGRAKAERARERVGRARRANSAHRKERAMERSSVHQPNAVAHSAV